MASKVRICFFYSNIFSLKSAVVGNESGLACVCRGFPFFYFFRDRLFFDVPFSSVAVFQEFPKTTYWIQCSEYIFFP